MPKIGRRAVLGAAGFAALGPLPAFASLKAARDGAIFDAVLHAVAGPVPVAQDLKNSALSAFQARFGMQGFDELMGHFALRGVAHVLERQVDPAHEQQIQWLCSYLFTGSENPDDTGARLVNYPHALCWKSLSFAKAPGLCGGPAFGHWAHDPTEQKALQ